MHYRFPQKQGDMVRLGGKMAGEGVGPANSCTFKVSAQPCTPAPTPSPLRIKDPE